MNAPKYFRTQYVQTVTDSGVVASVEQIKNSRGVVDNWYVIVVDDDTAENGIRPLTVKEEDIVEAVNQPVPVEYMLDVYLQTNGYGGLINDQRECACALSELSPDNCLQSGCVGAVAIPMKDGSVVIVEPSSIQDLIDEGDISAQSAHRLLNQQVKP